MDGHLNDRAKDIKDTDLDGEADDHEFAKLLRDAQAGDKQAANILLVKYRDYLLAIANQELESAIRPKVAASDLVQQSMIAIQGSLEQFRGTTKGEFQAWIKQILSHDLIDVRRKYRGAQQRAVAREQRLDDSRLAQPVLPDNQFTPGTDAQVKEEAELLRQATKRLPEHYQRVLQLRNWEELSFDKIGGELDCSADAARKLWFRAVQRLRQEMQQPP